MRLRAALIRTAVTAVLAVVAALSVLTVVLGAINPEPSGPPGPLVMGIFTLMLVFPVTGALLATKRPGNPIGWLFLLVGLGFATNFASEQYAVRALIIQPDLPAGIWAAWLSQWAFVVWLIPLPLVLLLFPDGRLPSPRWRPLAILIVAWGAVQCVYLAFRPGPIGSQQVAGFSNPFGIEAVAALEEFFEVSQVIAYGFLVCALAAILRFRGAKAVERQQLKLFAYAAALVATALAGLFMAPTVATLLGLDSTVLEEAMWLLFICSFAAVAIAVSVAILRYRLYDVDILIRRTLVYAVLSAVLVATYAVFVVVLQAAARPFTGGSELAVAGSTLVVVALVHPLRRRIQDAVDRRFSRTGYDAARTLEAFSARLRDEVDLDTVRRDMLDVVRETMRPAHATFWLRDRGGRP